MFILQSSTAKQQTLQYSSMEVCTASAVTQPPLLHASTPCIHHHSTRVGNLIYTHDLIEAIRNVHQTQQVYT